MTSGFSAVTGLEGVFVARAGKLSSIALRLRDNSLCIYSPVSGLETILAEQADTLGDVSTLLAPNHYHNKGLAAHVKAFPKASLCCSAAARPRLTQITGLKFAPLDDLTQQLWDGHSVHEPDGLKTGEVWLHAQFDTERALVVTDAFNSALQPPGSYGNTAGLLGTFPRYGVNDAALYTSWATGFLSKANPTMLLPCHGSPVRSADLTQQLTGLLQKAF